VTEIQMLFERLSAALKQQAVRHGLMEEEVSIQVRPMTPEEAIGSPDDRDYPIITGRERILEASFKAAKGHAFSDEVGNSTCTVKGLVERVPETTQERAAFIAALNAVYRHLGLCDRTVHCRDNEPRDCAQCLVTRIDEGVKVLLVGFQPRMLEFLSRRNPLRVVDMDPDNIGTTKFGVAISDPARNREGMEWCDVILATGSTIVNGTLPAFLDTGKSVILYGVTISAAAEILGLDRYCQCGH
jgi:uncharacterized protein (DUF4213/DUF364 family)